MSGNKAATTKRAVKNISGANLSAEVQAVLSGKSAKKPKKLWFKAKLYGWGWAPASWEGWFITFLYIVAVVFLFVLADGELTLFSVWLPVIGLTALYAAIAYGKGEEPHWHWGLKDARK